GHRIRVTPVPIPNTEVKPDTADGTVWETVWESRSLPALFQTTDAREPRWFAGRPCVQGVGNRFRRPTGFHKGTGIGFFARLRPESREKLRRIHRAGRDDLHLSAFAAAPYNDLAESLRKSRWVERKRFPTPCGNLKRFPTPCGNLRPTLSRRLRP